MPTTSEKFKECFELFSKYALDEKRIPYSCKIHDAFGGLKGKHHNCLGCNFTESTDLIFYYLKNHKKLKHNQRDITTYILLLYLLTERINVVFNILQLPDSYKEKHFKVFQRIRKWANFLKHPKSFILTHHPHYDFVDSLVKHTTRFSVKIDDEFVTKYYKGESDPNEQKKVNLELYEKLKNKKDVIVIFPEIAILTKNFCFAYKKFVDIIINNEIYIEILNDEATISDYFEKE